MKRFVAYFVIVIVLSTSCAHSKLSGTWRTRETFRAWGAPAIFVLVLQNDRRCNISLVDAENPEFKETLYGNWSKSKNVITLHIKQGWWQERDKFILTDNNTLILTTTDDKRQFVFQKQ